MDEKYAFIGNLPLGKDLLKNQSQEKVANLITEHIIGNKKFKIIGIDGTWGSGKSNLVRIIEQKLDNKYKFFIYDVWGHQEDEQRKAILVELTEFIKSDKNNLVSNKKNWEEKLTILLANRKQTKTINQPYLSIGFIFALLSIIYVPLVNVFKDVDFFGIQDNIWKFVLVTAPILLVVIIYIWNVVANIFKGMGISCFKLAAEETFQIYTNKQKEETKIETISENQPSVRDFQNWMSDIDKDLKKPVVIVFDNFDRLPKKHILSIWSSIHIFFSEKKYDKIKIIIPFDREHLQNAFKELNRDNSDKAYADDYINKTFDIVFRVPAPIMSDWKKFVRDNWRIAFTSDENLEELDKVIQVYEYLNKRTTPREIIAFINEIITIKYIDEKFKERYIAIFILCKDHILDNPLSGITKLTYLKGLEPTYINDSIFAQQITGIVYHVPPESALELIYTEELRKAIYQRNVERFNEICRTDFVDDIFFSVINATTDFPNVIFTLGKLSDETKLSNTRIREVWNLIYDKLLLSEDKKQIISIEEWELEILSKIDDNRYLIKLIDNFYELDIRNNIQDFVQVIDRLFEKINRNRVHDLLNLTPIPPKDLVDVINQKGDHFVDYQVFCVQEEIDSYLTTLPLEIVLNSIPTKTLANRFELPKYKSMLQEKITPMAQNNEIQQVSDIVAKLKELVKKNGDMKGVLSDAHIYGLHINYSGRGYSIDNELVAMRLALAKQFSPSYSSHFDSIRDSDSGELSGAISSTILNYESYGTLLLQAKMFTENVLYKSVIRNLISYNIQKELVLPDILSEYTSIKSSLELSGDQLIKELDQGEINSSEINLDDLPDDFIDDCIKYPEFKISKKFISKLNESFSKMNNQLLEEAFCNPNNIFVKYFDTIHEEYLTQNSLNVFKNSLILAMKEGLYKEFHWTILRRYDSLSGTFSIVNILKDIRDDIHNGKINIDISMFLKICPYFFKYKLIDPRMDIFRTIFKTEFINDNDFIELISTNTEYFKSILDESDSDDKKDFVNTIKESTEKYDLINLVAKIIT